MFESFLFAIDLTGIPVTMNLFGREKVKTRFGGICSILFLGYVMWAVYNSAYELLTTINPKIVSYEYFKDDPRAIILNHETFPVGFAMQASAMLNYRTYKDSSIFTIRMTHQRMERTRTENGGTLENWTISKIYTENCPPDYFGAQASSLGDMNLNSMYCLAKEQPELDKLEIQGVFSSSVYEAIVVEVAMCDNSTSNGTCAPPEKIEEYLSGGWFNMVYVNMVVNPQNYTSPNNTYKDIYYTMVDPDNYRETEVNLGYVEINTDKGWFTESFSTKTYTKLEKIVEYLNTDPRPDKVLIQCSLKVSQLETYYTRSYKKVQGVLAEAGGMINVGLAIMVLVVTPFMRVKFREALMNELFDVRLPQNKNQNKKRKRDSYQPEKSKEGPPPRKCNANQIDKITLATLKNTFMTNLSSTEDYVKSPNSPEKRKGQDHIYKKRAFLCHHSNLFLLRKKSF